MREFTPELKNDIFVQRTKDLWPQNWNYYLELISHELWSKDQLAEYNFLQRKNILKYAYENSRFYKRLYDDAGLTPQDIKTESDWEKVPIVTKQMVSDFSRDIEIEKVIKDYGFPAHTGGSTGKPLRVFRDKRHFWQAPWWRFYGWHLGRKAGEPECSYPIWGLDYASIDRSYYRASEQWIQQRKIAFWPISFINLSPYAEFEKDIDRFITELKKSPAAKIYAYTGGLDMFLDYCIKQRIYFKNVLFIDAGASPLTNIIRNKVKLVFSCDVFDFYGSNEMGPMALECNSSGTEHYLHVMSDLLDIQLVDDNNQVVPMGETGTTIITSFENRVFPFVRYNHGDRTHYVNHNCDCNLPFPCIAPVRGRATEYLITKQGTHIDGVGFNEIFDFYPEAALAFQFRQNQNGIVRLVVVPGNNHSHALEEINIVLSKLNDDFKDRIEFSLELTDSIKYDAGKIRYIVHD